MSLGFKEWKLVCDALESGRQSIILRKGGIAEGRGGFQFEHDEFFLFPTYFHEQSERLRLEGEASEGAGSEDPDESKVEIRLAARIAWAANITKWESVKGLEPFHIWNEDVLEERFDYTGLLGLRMAVLRVYRLAEPWILEQRPEFGGCRSWLDLPEEGEALWKTATPVLTDDAFVELETELENWAGHQGVMIRKAA